MKAPLDERPELPGQSVTREQCRRLACGGRLPRKFEARPIPVRTESVKRLWLHDGTACKPVGLEPCLKFRFRPEGGDVPSGEADVVPEMPRRHQEMNHRVSENRAG